MSNKSCMILTAALLCSTLPAWSQGLPDGKGKELAAANCESCHTLLSRVGAGYTLEGWRTVMRMMANHGVATPADQVAPLTEYLVKAFPEKGKPAGVVIPGPAKISIKEWKERRPFRFASPSQFRDYARSAARPACDFRGTPPSAIV